MVYFAQNTSELLTALGVKVIVRDKTWAESKKMGSFLSVARGSAEPPVFLELHYSAAANKPITLVGKFWLCVWFRIYSFQPCLL